jgi:predicted GIY-YIG superfamily endonuclease
MNTYIYVLREKDVDEIKYVGRTANPTRRLAEHLRDADPNSHSKKARWIAAVLQRGGEIDLNVIETCDQGLEGERERYWIKLYEESPHPITNGRHGAALPSGVPSKQLTITLSKAMRLVVEEARQEFPHAQSDAQALTFALIDWFHNRTEQATEDEDYIDARVQEMEKKVDEILALLRGQHDTDHA